MIVRLLFFGELTLMNRSREIHNQLQVPMNTSVTYHYDVSNRKIALAWPDGFQTTFHLVWLRHHARCADGMPNDTTIKIDLLPRDVQSLRVAHLHIEKEYLCIQWTDNELRSLHSLEDLRNSAYDHQSRQSRKHRPTLWDSASAVDIPHFAFSELTSKSTQLDLLLSVRDYGIAKISKVPSKPNTIKVVADIFGPMHVNNYGDIFNVKSDSTMNLGSNTGVHLPPHTDESYRHEAPGISLFHCIEPAIVGGESLLVDGFKVLNDLKTQYKESFQVLTQVPLYFRRYAPTEEDMRSHTRVIATDVDGDVIGIRWTDRTLPPQDIPDQWIEPVYQALSHLHRLISTRENQYQYKMEAGDLHVFDNHRVLHGRTAFDILTGSRHLQQCSINRDEFHNKLRLLSATLNRADFNLILNGGAAG